MKLSFPHFKVRSIFMAGAVACTIAVSALAPLASSIASAADPPGSPTAAPAGERYDRLERLFKLEVRVLAGEEKRLGQMAKLANRIQTYIDAQAAKGKDVKELQAALDDFRAAMTKAQSEHDAAKAILDAHAGFGPNGEVVDMKQANTTVRTAGKDEREFRQTVRKALHALKNAVHVYREHNKH
ncbi:MAG: hypothetical protein HYX94_03985 [Chloroflexi bacterium]|nr:hypothetical protein [Chloroflexota bacterium]